MLEGGKTPLLPKQRLAELGFHLILHPLAGLFAAAAAIKETYSTLKRDHTTADLACPLMDFRELNSLVGADAWKELAARYGE